MFDRYRLISVPFLVRWIPILVLLLAAFWRFQDIEQQSFWHDEGNTLRLIQRDMDALIDAVRPDIHPPGYYLVLKGWTAFVGEHEFGLRSLSAFWGMLTVLFTYALGVKLYEAKAAGILAAFLVAVNAFQVYYSQEARMYAQLAALTTLSLWLLTLLVTTRPTSRRFWWTAAALMSVNTLGLYTQYTYAFTMLVQGIFFLWAKGKHLKALLIYFLLNGLTLLFFLPWLPTAYDQITTWPTTDTGESFSEKITTLATYITYGNSASGLTLLDFLWPFLLAAALFLPDYYAQKPPHIWRVGLPLVWIGVVCGALLFSGAYREANLKFLLPAQVGLALLIGRGAYLLWDVGTFSAALPLQMIPRVLAGLAFLATASISYQWLQVMETDSAFQRDDYQGIAEIIMATETPQDAILLNAPNQYEVFTYYYKGNLPLYPLPRGYGGDDAATLAETQQILAQHPCIFVLFWGEGERDPNGIVRNTLDTNAYEVYSRWYGHVRLVLYAVLQDPPDEPTHVIQQPFGEHMTLKGYAVSGEGVTTPGNVVGVTLFWETDEKLNTRYKVTVQLLKPDGTLASQHDSEPANGRHITTDWQPGTTIVDNHGILVPQSLTPDDQYQLIVSVYELDYPQNRLPVNNNDFLILERLIVQ
ncbi:MAG: glycosyltransferase family 39 protein [Anaerolineae bacterium]|nr:glycosyltransferase family 39 protein [Anaerolineae bacterium]